MASKNVAKTQNSVYELGKIEMNNITPEEWSAAVRLAIKQEDLYIEIDQFEYSENHENSVAVEEPEVFQKETLKCDNCDFETINGGNFKEHTKSTVECSVCLKRFCGLRAKNQLKKHEKSHVQKACIHCNKSFKFASDLKKHLVWSACGRK